MASEKLKDERPWGTWETLAQGPDYKIKRIVECPGQRLSCQRHARRREIWTAATGEGLVTLDGAKILLRPGDTVEVSIGAAHRVANPGKTDFVFVEVQLGSYFWEDDIVRLEDDYGRADGR